LIHVKAEARQRNYHRAMSTRTIITIDTTACTGCGLCIPNCPEGALQIIDGKARLVSDLFCDGLGACVGYCPEGAITLTEREAEPYDERGVMAAIVAQGANTTRAHLEHLESHGQRALLDQALAFLKESGTPVPDGFAPSVGQSAVPARPVPGLANWPIQLHLLSPMAPQLAGRDVLVSADCVAHAVPNFQSLLAGKSLAIACPKLDEGKDIYREKITALIDHAGIASLTVAMMEVPCCRGLLAIVEQARAAARRKVPLTALVVAIDGGAVLSETAL
jgi:ferredoxin